MTRIEISQYSKRSGKRVAHAISTFDNTQDALSFLLRCDKKFMKENIRFKYVIKEEE